MCEEVASAHHLLLDTEALSIANAKMKSQRNFIGFFIIGLLTQYGLAEHDNRHAYLPPEIQNAITEEIITIEEHSQGGQAQFDESRYGGGKYQVYEVHHHYEPEPLNTLTQTETNAPGYLPPIQDIHVQQIQQPQKPVVRHLDIPSSSFVNDVSTSVQEVSQPFIPKSNTISNEKILNIEQFHISQLNNVKGQKSVFKAADYLPPHHGNRPVLSQHLNPGSISPTQQFKGPDYLPPHEQYSNFINHKQQTAVEQSEFKGPDYLPPHQANSHQSQPIFQLNQGEEHIHHHEAHQHVLQAGEFKGPDYLPPSQGSSHHTQHNIQGQFKGPDYLPPHQISSIQVQNQVNPDVKQGGQFEGPDYLPSHANEEFVQQHHHHSIDGQHQIQQTGKYKGPDYLPPHNEHQTAGNFGSQQNQFKAPDYLPPHEDHRNYYQPLNHQGTQHIQSHRNQYQQVEQAAQFRAPDYLPPHEGTNQPGALPPGYEFSSPGVSLSESQPQFQQPIQQSARQAQQTQPLVGAAELPAGYDFEKPSNSEEAIAELHTLPKEDHQEFVVQSQIQVRQNEEQLQAYSGQQQSGINYQTNAYLPPSSEQQQTSANYQVPLSNTQKTLIGQQNDQKYQSNIQQTSPQIFTKSPPTAAAQPPVSNYLPPTRPVQAEQYSTNLHSLSSFMNTVQPNVRYGVAQFTAPRQPFREYGPPPTNVAVSGNAPTQSRQQQHQHQQQHQLPVVSPMYRDQTSRPPYYAPTMSYATNSLANSHTTTTSTRLQTHHQHHASLNQQTTLNLQQFMPQDVRQFNHNYHSNSIPARATATGSSVVPKAPAVSGRQTPSSRIRTVQILNPSTTKTLKVLETLDQAGVKTIKILGPSNTHPIGEHHIIKVVSQSANSPHEQVQTVKIFNDHQGTPSSGSNEYLPPVTRVLRQSLSNKKLRTPFTGRRRYRH